MATTTPPLDTYALTDEQVEFRDVIRRMVVERVAPRAADIDAKAEYPWDLRKLFAEHARDLRARVDDHAPHPREVDHQWGVAAA